MQAAQQTLYQQIIPIPFGLPQEAARALSGRSVSSEREPVIRVPKSVMRFIRQPEPLPVSEFADRHRYVADGAHPGPWRIAYAPHTKKVMDAFGAPWVREVWFCGVDQSGKSNTLLNCLIWSIVHTFGHMFLMMAREEDVKKVIRSKVIPMLQGSPMMARYLSDRADDTGLAVIALKNGKNIIPAHANSPAAMATWSAACSFADEVDKYPPMAGSETSPIELIRKRSRTFRGRFKHFFASTPAGRFIYKGALACQQVWEGRILCPHCGELIRMDADHLTLPDKATADDVALLGCSYACNHCGAEITEAERQRALARGPWWTCVKGADIAKPETVGFLHRAWDCHDLSLANIAAAFLRGRDGDLSAKRDWAHGYEAMDYEEEFADREVAAIMRLAEKGRMRREVPLTDVQCLLMLVDTQREGFFYQVWAVEWGKNPRVHVIDRSFRRSFEEIAELSRREWKDAAGKGYRVLAAWIDSGGGTDPYHPKHSRTSQVYEFCKANPVFHPVKGRRGQVGEGQGGASWAVSRLEYMPGSGGRKKPIPGGLNLWLLNVTTYKNDLAHCLAVEPGDPGSMSLFESISEDFAHQMCAEYQDDRGFWVCPPHRANHDWDIAVYGMAAIDIMGLRQEKAAAVRQPAAPVIRDQARRRW